MEGATLYLIFSSSVEFVHKERVKCGFQLITKRYRSNHVAVVLKVLELK